MIYERLPALTRCVAWMMCAWGAVHAGALAQDAREVPEPITPRTRNAIEKGLAYLGRTQNRDGSWLARGAFATQTGYPCAMTSLAGLALMSAGNTPVEGQYSRNVRRAADYVAKQSNRTGLISSSSNTARPMHGHGYSMLFLAQVYGMEPVPARQAEIRRVLRRAIDLTTRSQSPDGGWYYTPDSRTDEGSVTVTQIQGLRACRNAGIQVPKSTIDGATGYIEKCSNENGGISYRLGMRGTRPAITAAAVATMYNAGEYEHPVAANAMRYTLRHVREHRQEPFDGYRGHSYYGVLYASQALWFAGDEEWRELFPAIRDAVLARQQEDGSWQGDNVGKIYGTSVALIVLQLPNKYLPILQR